MEAVSEGPESPDNDAGADHQTTGEQSPASKIHPVAEIIPPMLRDEFKKLVEDVGKYGLREPIVTYKGQIIDGRHREKACKIAGIEPRYIETDKSTEEAHLRDYVLSRNVHRRQLAQSQRAAGTCKLATAKKGRKSKNSNAMTVEQAAELFGVSERYVQKARSIQEADADLFEHLFDGSYDIPRAEEELGLRRKEKEKKAEEKRKNVQQLEQQKRAEENANLKAEQAQLPAQLVASSNQCDRQDPPVASNGDLPGKTREEPTDAEQTRSDQLVSQEPAKAETKSSLPRTGKNGWWNDVEPDELTQSQEHDLKAVIEDDFQEWLASWGPHGRYALSHVVKTYRVKLVRGTECEPIQSTVLVS